MSKNDARPGRPCLLYMVISFVKARGPLLLYNCRSLSYFILL